ncbi:ParA family protein [Dactylosporangium sp. NPDC051485]|uniref:ParA family protein n=1 Tax=Dactylosporangium sp. NPDC051485 TaxID=3154846 RepID=UPI0034287511
MALIAVCSAKGSPGATTTALALALRWPRRVLLAECDPAGGDLAAGFLCEVALDGRGLDRLTSTLARRPLTANTLWNELVDLAPDGDSARTKLLLPGLADPAQAATWGEPQRTGQAAGWDQLAAQLPMIRDGAEEYDVIADCGRLAAAHPATPLITKADLVLLVLRPTLISARAASAALQHLLQPGRPPVALVTVGDGSYRTKELALELRTPVAAALPDDTRSADALSQGITPRHGRLLRAAGRVDPAIRRISEEDRLPAATPAVLGRRRVDEEADVVH